MTQFQTLDRLFSVGKYLNLKVFLSLSFAFVSLVACDQSSKNSNENQEQVSDVSPSIGSCAYTNLFSSSSECRNYTGEAWSLEQAQSDCTAQQASSFSTTSCDLSAALGLCRMSGEAGLDYELVLSGEAPNDCQIAVQGCVIFARGEFLPSEACIGQFEPVEPALPDEIGTVFVPFELMCLENQTSSSEERCTWQAIGGCAPEGELFTDYASCNPVLTQRPYAPVPASGFETPQDDPLRANQAYLDEVEWVRSQAKSCGCVCCHEDGQAPSGAAVWDTNRAGLWIDDWNPSGLAMGAGWLDSSSLGAFDAVDNNGFDRSLTVLPTTNVDRMVRFFEGELARRGFVPEDFSNDQPIGGPLYQQSLYQPSVCEAGEGVKLDGTIQWSGGGARYIYVLEANSENPGVPPNFDVPAGTIWKLDVNYQSSAITELNYADIPENTKQAFPQEGQPSSLEIGQEYYLYVLRDIASPLTRCLFTYGEESETEQETNTTVEAPWAQTCVENSDCPAPTDFCVKAPGDAEGYCSVHCASANACAEAGAPSAWACVAVSCEAEAFTWCGDPSEVEESGGFLKLCP